MTLTIVAAVLFLAHVAAWIAAPSSSMDAAPMEMPEMAVEAQAS